jgi:hypothetical protein
LFKPGVSTDLDQFFLPIQMISTLGVAYSGAGPRFVLLRGVFSWDLKVKVFSPFCRPLLYRHPDLPGIIGEHIGRIYQEVRRRPAFTIKKELMEGSFSDTRR